MELSNKHNLIEFDDAGNIQILMSPKRKRNYLAKGGCQLFRITLVETYEGTILPGELALTPEMAEEITVRKKENTVRLKFRKLDGLAISVTAKIELADREVRWSLSFQNQTAFAVKEIEYPWFVFRTPLGADAETERFLVPKMDGVLLGNPKLHPWQKDEKGTYTERYWYPGEGKQIPKNLSVQLTAYYDKTEGILIYADDKVGHPKKIGPVLINEDEVDLAPVHLRPEVAGLDFDLEYEVVTQFFEGDWKDAAMLYRDFARTAPWCERTIEEREEIPQWIKDGAFFLSFRLRYQKEKENFLERVPEFVNRWKQVINMPMVAMMCGWEKIGEWAGPDYFPPYGGEERFKKMCDGIKRDGNKAFTFGLSGLKLLIRRRKTKAGDQPELAVDYNGRKKFREAYIHFAALDINGMPIIKSNMDAWDGVHCYACPKTDQAMDQICGASIKMLKEYGVTVQQADQVLGGGTAECYSKKHDHLPGRGIWQVESLKHIYEETRRQCKKINPDFILSEEWISEPYIQHLDIYHCRNYDKPQGGLESVPLFSFLYHQYIPCYAGDWTSFLPTNNTGVYFHGWNFVCGNLPAGSPIDMLKEMENHDPEDADPYILEMAKNACAAFKKNTDFLIKGEMLPTEELKSDKMQIRIEGLDFGFPRPEITVPSVLHMFWKNPTGRVACAAANVSDSEKQITLPIAQYASRIKSISLEVNGERITKKIEIRNGVLELTISPRAAVMVHVNQE